jgi:cell division protein FtsI (penicillin-binding protein 3)
MKKQSANMLPWNVRRQIVLLVFALMGLTLIGRALYLQVIEYDFYRGEGDARHLRTVAIPAHRGNMNDRNGEPLAISTPIKTVWGVPEKLMQQPAALREVAALLDLQAGELQVKTEKAYQQGKEFMYVKRHINPDVADKVAALNVEGLMLQREYRRYYPSGRAAAHVVGFTDIDDIGREGLEMAYEDWLSGEPGKRRTMRDRTGREITGMDVVEQAVPGKDLRLSIDKQLQYFADQALIDVVSTHKAESASVVVMKVKTGEVLAMSNFPAYNPNDVSDRTSDRGNGRQRNRSITDVFEPGSTMKPFTIAAALDSGKFKPEDIVFTSPGYYSIGKYQISDVRDNGWLDLRGIVKKSSNVGVSKVATQLDPEQMWSVFDTFGFGRSPGSEFPGEVAGYFNHPILWHHIEQASISYGYGISVSALQLVRAYAALANDGLMPNISFLATDEPSEGVQVIDPQIARDVTSMLESVVTDGTGGRAKIPGYRIAGKTGTSHRSVSGGYAEDRYVSVFAGYAPASRPELATVVVIHDPKAGQHFGSVVAAPVFADVMSHALRIQNVEPDDVDDQRLGLGPVLGQSQGDRS